jgi:hypothetical protein
VDRRGSALFLSSADSGRRGGARPPTCDPLVAQVRAAVAGGTDLPAVLATLRDRTEGSDYGVYLQLADGRIVGLGGESATLEGIEIDPTAPRGGVDRGTFRSSDGASAAWVASFLRNPGARGQRAVVLTTPDRPGQSVPLRLALLWSCAPIGQVPVLAPAALGLGRSGAGAATDLPRPGATRSPLGPDGVDLTIGSSRCERTVKSRRPRDRLGPSPTFAPLTVIAGFSAALTDGTATGDDATGGRGDRREADRIGGRRLFGRSKRLQARQAGQAAR